MEPTRTGPTEPLSEQRLDEIEYRANAVYAGPWKSMVIDVARADVPALVAEVKRLKAALRDACDHIAEQDSEIGAQSVRAGAAEARHAGLTSALAVIVKHGDMSETTRREISDLLADEAGAR